MLHLKKIEKKKMKKKDYCTKIYDLDGMVLVDMFFVAEMTVSTLADWRNSDS